MRVHHGVDVPKNPNFLLVLVTLAAVLALGVFIGRQNTPVLGVEFYSVCSRSMERIIAGGQGDVYDFSGVEEFEEPDVYNLALYSVEGDVITNPVFESVPADLKDEQNDLSLQAHAWEVFTELIPPANRQMVAQFNVFTDGVDNTLAAVDVIQDDISSWKLEVDIADLENTEAFIFTLVHEYAHLLTLDSSQVTPDQDLADDPYNLVLQSEKAFLCPNYFTGMGCSRPDSYVHAFYHRFWADFNDEWEDVDAIQYQPDSNVEYYNALYDFYRTHRDQFVGDYAVTHPTEDIAESFAHFVFSPKPPGDSIREQKIRFFYGYPELIRLRGEILKGACSLNK